MPQLVRRQRQAQTGAPTIMKPFGLDASVPQFWDMGLKVIEEMIDELERMDRAGTVTTS